MRRRHPNAGGFTLLEMLAATAMVAMLAGSLYASLHIAFKARNTATAAMEAVRKSSLSMEIIRADLQSAMVPHGTLASEFTGSPSATVPGAQGDSLVFCSSASDIQSGPGVGDVKKIEYFCELSPGTGRLELIRRVTTNLLAPETAAPRQEILARDVRAFTLRYFDGQTWEDAWDSVAKDNVLPKAVEVTIELSGNGGPGSAGPSVSRVVLIPCGQDSSATASTSSGGTP